MHNSIVHVAYISHVSDHLVGSLVADGATGLTLLHHLTQLIHLVFQVGGMPMGLCALGGGINNVQKVQTNMFQLQVLQQV